MISCNRTLGRSAPPPTAQSGSAHALGVGASPAARLECSPGGATTGACSRDWSARSGWPGDPTSSPRSPGRPSPRVRMSPWRPRCSRAATLRLAPAISATGAVILAEHRPDRCASCSSSWDRHRLSAQRQATRGLAIGGTGHPDPLVTIPTYRTHRSTRRARGGRVVRDGANRRTRR